MMKRERSESRATISGWRVNYIKTRGIRIAIIRRRTTLTMNFQKKNVQMKTKNIDIHDSSLDKLSSSARKRNINRIESERKYNFLLPWWSLEGSTSQSAVLEPVPAGSSLYHICYAKYSENKGKILKILSDNFDKNLSIIFRQTDCDQIKN